MDARSDKTEIVWIERLTIFEVYRFSLKSLFSQLVVYYDKEQASAQAKALVSRSGYFRNFLPAELSIEKKDRKGYSVQYHFEEHLSACSEHFASKHIPGQMDAFKKMLTPYFSSYLYWRLVFITMAEYSEVFQGSDPQDNLFYISRHPLNSVLIEYFREKGYRIQQSPFTGGSFKYYLRPVYHLLSVLLARFGFGRGQTNIVDPRAAVWVEYGHSRSHVDFNFWSRGAGKDYDIACYFDRSDDAPIPEMAKEVEARGFKWINLHFRSLLSFARLGFRDLGKMCRAFFYCGSGSRNF